MFASMPTSPPALLAADANPPTRTRRREPADAPRPQDQPQIARGRDGYLVAWSNRRTTFRPQRIADLESQISDFKSQISDLPIPH